MSANISSKAPNARERACAQTACMRSWWQPLRVKEPTHRKNLKIVYSVAIILIVLWELCLNKQTRKPTLRCLYCLSIHISYIAVLFGLNHKSPKITGFRIWWLLAACGAINFLMFEYQSLSLKVPTPCQRAHLQVFSILSHPDPVLLVLSLHTSEVLCRCWWKKVCSLNRHSCNHNVFSNSEFYSVRVHRMRNVIANWK